MAEKSSMSENALTAEGVVTVLRSNKGEPFQDDAKETFGITNDLIKSELEKDSNTAFGIDDNYKAPLDGVTESMIKEEKRLEDEAMQLISIESSKKLREESKVQLEKRYVQLQKLLQRSKFFTQYLGKKIAESKNQITTAEPKDPPVNAATRENPKRNCKRKKIESSSSDSSIDDEYQAKMYKKFKLKECEIVLSAKDEKRCKTKNECVSEIGETYQTTRPYIEQPKLFTGGIMRQYQIEGLNWMKVLYENALNGILGDEMGLGKTIQCIGLIAHLIENKVPGPFIIVAPLSTLPNWVSEFQKFTPSVPVILYHGTLAERKIMLKGMKLKHIDGRKYSCYPVIITSYNIILTDISRLKKYKWNYLIVDEGQRIKNMNCLLIQRLKEMHTANRMLLTGTPLQNNLAELWSLLNFLLPELFHKLEIFESWFDISSMMEDGSETAIIQQERDKHIIATLREILEPFLLRRIKSEVEIALPPKREFLVYASLTEKQSTMYKAILNKTIASLFEQTKVKAPVVESDEKRLRSANPHRNIYDGPKIKTADVKFSHKFAIMDLRKCVDHPYLIEYPIDLQTEDYLVNEDIVRLSGKLTVLDILLKKLIPEHKVVIFSQMVEMLNIIHDYCVWKSFGFRRLDGSMALEERMEAMEDFKNDPNVSIFLVSTRAGGVGLNLAVADTVILYDSDWNPQCDLQAMDRCHRIGQTKAVVIYRLVVAGTIDEYMIKRAAAKRKLEKMIIHNHKSAFNKSTADKYGFTAAEILALLKSEEHDNIVYSNEREVFSKEELNLLLDRSFGHKDASNSVVSTKVEILNGSET